MTRCVWQEFQWFNPLIHRSLKFLVLPMTDRRMIVSHESLVILWYDYKTSKTKISEVGVQSPDSNFQNFETFRNLLKCLRSIDVFNFEPWTLIKGDWHVLLASTSLFPFEQCSWNTLRSSFNAFDCRKLYTAKPLPRLS